MDKRDQDEINKILDQIHELTPKAQMGSPVPLDEDNLGMGMSWEEMKKRHKAYLELELLFEILHVVQRKAHSKEGQ